MYVLYHKKEYYLIVQKPTLNISLLQYHTNNWSGKSTKEFASSEMAENREFMV